MRDRNVAISIASFLATEIKQLYLEGKKKEEIDKDGLIEGVISNKRKRYSEGSCISPPRWKNTQAVYLYITITIFTIIIMAVLQLFQCTQYLEGVKSRFCIM